MVDEQIVARGVPIDGATAMREVPRHLFVPPDQQPLAYDDQPGRSATIDDSQPDIVALMTELLRPQPGDRALESVQAPDTRRRSCRGWRPMSARSKIVESLGREAETRLKKLGYANVSVRVGDGYAGMA